MDPINLIVALKTIFSIIFLLILSHEDIRRREISVSSLTKILSISFLLIAADIALNPPGYIIVMLWSCLLTASILALPYKFGYFGGGDVKILILLAALFPGLYGALQVLIFAMIFTWVIMALKLHNGMSFPFMMSIAVGFVIKTYINQY